MTDVLAGLDSVAADYEVLLPEHAGYIREMRAAVAELIESSDLLSSAIMFRIDDPRMKILDRVVMALKRVRRPV